MSIRFAASFPTRIPPVQVQPAKTPVRASGPDTFMVSSKPLPTRFSGKGVEAAENKEAEAPKVYRFGTSGWRAIEDFTPEAVSQVTNAFGDYLIGEMERQGKLLPVLLGGDTREKTRLNAPLIAKQLNEKGLDVYQSDTDLPSPVLAYAAKYFSKIEPKHAGTAGAVLLTASHNPWAYGGYNFLTPEGAVMDSQVSKQVEDLQKHPQNKKLTLADRKRLGGESEGNPQYRFFNAYNIYKDHLTNHLKIDFDAIRKSGLSIHYDPLYATGRQYLPRLLGEQGVSVNAIHDTDVRPAGYTGMPDPTGDNLGELKALVKDDPARLKVGFANDGDSDRFGVLDENGRYITPNEALLLMTYHLIKNKGQQGVVVRNQGTTTMLDALARKHDLPVVETPVGYKYIAGEFEKREEHPEGPQVLIGGESSGGLSVMGHLPEKDGIVANLLIAELVAKENRPPGEILKDIRNSLKEGYAFREAVVKTPRGKDMTDYFGKLQQKGGHIGSLQIDTEKSTRRAERLENRYGTRDGSKIWFTDGSWLLIRPSGTEPVVRLMMECVAPTEQEAEEKRRKLLDAARKLLAKDFGVKADDIQEKAT